MYTTTSLPTSNNQNGGPNNLKQLYGSVPFKVPYGGSVVSNLKNTANAMFPPVQDGYGIIPGEIAFRFTDFKSSSKGFYFITSLNGAGLEEYSEYPDDEDMQVSALESRIEVIGSTMHLDTERSLTGTNGAVNRSGIRPGFAHKEVLFGNYIKASVPHPSKIRDGSILFPKGSPNGKVTLIYEPVSSETNCERFINMTQKFASDPNKLLPLRTVKGRLQNREYNAFISVQKQKIIDSLIFIDQLEKSGLIAPIMFRDGLAISNNPAVVGLGVNTWVADTQWDATTNALLAIAAAFDVLTPSKAATVYRPNNAQRTFVDDLKNRVIRALNWDGRTANLAMGYNPHTKTNTGLERNQIRDDALGEFIGLQYNHRKMLFMSLEEFWKNSWDKILGKVIAPANAGQEFLYI